MTNTIRLPHKIKERVKNLFLRTGRNKAFSIKKVNFDYLFDLYDISIAGKRLESIRSGRTKTIPLQDIIEGYGYP
jgi:RHH-type rel operon transcriptional repressor/antitoxin RelB